MQISKSQFGGFIFLILFICYGILATRIQLDFFSEQDVFNARSLPIAISIAGSLISLLLILTSGKPATTELPNTNVPISAYKTTLLRTFLIIIAMLVYGSVLDYLGFIVSTTGFLIVGYWIMGERRIWVLLAGSVPLVLVFWFIMNALGIYLSPGELYFELTSHSQLQSQG